jgi:hypothetical protein
MPVKLPTGLPLRGPSQFRLPDHGTSRLGPLPIGPAVGPDNSKKGNTP